MSKNNLNIRFAIISSLLLHSVAFAVIFSFSNNFTSPNSSIIEVKIEKFDQERNIEQKNSTKYELKKTSNKNNNEIELSNVPRINHNLKKNNSNHEVKKQIGNKTVKISRKKFEVKDNYSNQIKSTSSTKQSKKQPNFSKIEKTGIKSKVRYKIGSHNNPHPVYPLIARKKGWEGKVIVQADVDKVGNVTYIKILKSSGYKALDKVSLETLKKWKFTPAKLGSNFVNDTVYIPVNFVLKK